MCVLMSINLVYFFFFQAEDGIRDLTVTGVQTCALPIYARRGVLSTHLFADGRHAEKLWVDAPGLAHDPFISAELIQEGKHRAVMEGREVFKFASVLKIGRAHV